jgi:hypothetical protein
MSPLLFRVLPVPPFQALGVGVRLRGEVDGAAERVEDAAVLVDAAEFAEFFVEPLRIAAAQGGNAPDAQVVKVLREAGADAGDALEVFEMGGWGLGSLHGGASIRGVGDWGE